jgi:hypothetical protein
VFKAATRHRDNLRPALSVLRNSVAPVNYHFQRFEATNTRNDRERLNLSPRALDLRFAGIAHQNAEGDNPGCARLFTIAGDGAHVR